ncbi:MAG: glycoside hydrolase family 130 protein [Terriglobia bacterium]
MQPIFRPQGNGFESAGVFNPSVVRDSGRIVMLYRAQDAKGVSSFGFATSSDGLHFKAWPKPVFFAQADYEEGGGVEDPRIVKIGGTFYMTYTGYHNQSSGGVAHRDAQLCLATSTDLIHWTRHGVIMPAYQGAWNVGWTKSGAILPEKINSRYWMYYLGDAKKQGSQMGVANSADLLHWKDALDRPVLSSRPGKFDSRVVEPGPPPLLLKDGILLIYNGADDHLAYSTGWVLFDRQDPTRVLARASEPILRPQTPWEKHGQTPNVVFVEGMIRRSAKWLFYYGGADKYVGVAEAKVQ